MVRPRDGHRRAAAAAVPPRGDRRGPLEPIPIAEALAARDDAHLLWALSDHKVKFVVVGGMAGRALGAMRPTRDLDITPARTSENLRCLVAALGALGAQRRTAKSTHGEPTNWTVAFLRTERGVPMVTPHGILDLATVPTGTTGYGDLARRASEREIAGLRVLIPSLADYRRMKRALGRERDLDMLAELDRIYGPEQ